MVEMKHRIQITIGDKDHSVELGLSSHGRAKTFKFLTSHCMSYIKKAYCETGREIGLSFKDLCKTSYYLTKEQVGLLVRGGYDITALDDYDVYIGQYPYTVEECVIVTPTDIIDILLWMIEYSLPRFKWIELKEENHEELFKDKSIGYGCFEGFTEEWLRPITSKK